MVPTPIVNYYLAGLLLNAIISLGVAVVAFRLRRNPGALWLGLFLLAVVWWSLVLFAEFSITALPLKIFWAKMEYLGSMSGLIFLLFFAMEFSHSQQYFKHPYWLLYLIIPVITIGLVLTNEFHQLIWTSFTPVDIPGSNAFWARPLFWGGNWLCLSWLISDYATVFQGDVGLPLCSPPASRADGGHYGGALAGQYSLYF